MKKWLVDIKPIEYKRSTSV
jgi:actin-related protein 5